MRRGIGQTWVAWGRAATCLETHLPHWLPAGCAAVIALAVVVTSVRESQWVAAASDAWGYVSQADMWASGALRRPEPLMPALAGVMPREALAPLAYRPGLDGASIVPVTSPGLPMLMALFELAFGRSAVFVVVPMLAALTVWATFLLGQTLVNRWTGVLAAGLVAASPAFLFQLTSAPMSDIPATAFWTLSLVCALRGRGLWSGIAAGVAVLVRANLAPLAIVPAAIVYLARHKETRRPRRQIAMAAADVTCRPTTEAGYQGLRAVGAFATGVLPAVVAIAALYTYWYGSPLNSGYGTLEQLYSAGNVQTNLARYSRWLLESETPIVIAALCAPLWLERRAALGLLAFAAAVLGAYVFYIPFDAWWYLRFLLPGFPALLALTAATIVTLARWLPLQVRAVTVAMVALAVANHMVDYASARATFDSEGEQKYAITGRYVDAHLPQNAVIFSEIHSGSIRYYSGRTTIRFGSIPSDHLEGTVIELQRLGYHPYLIAEDWEEDLFRQQFAGRNILALLAGGPQTELPLGRVRIYPLAR